MRFCNFLLSLAATTAFASTSAAQSPHSFHATGRAGLSGSDGSALRAAYDAARHAARVTPDGARFRNPGQQWTVDFDGRGFVVKPDAGGWTWGLEIGSVRDAGGILMSSQTSKTSVDGDRVNRAWSPEIVEWVRNTRNGVEHGWTLQERPAAGSGELIFSLTVRGDLKPRVLAGGRDIVFDNAKGAAVVSYSGLHAFDSTGVSLPAKFEERSGMIQLRLDDSNARYPITIDPVAQQVYLKGSNTATDDNFGCSVAVSGETVVVGAYSEDSNASGVNGDQNNNAGGDSGAAYVFVRNQGTWTQQAYLKASTNGVGDWFGEVVAISGDTIAVSARQEDSNATGVNGNQANNSASSSGAVYIFVRNGTTWTQQAYLKASNTGAFDFFGSSLAISGDTVVVGANGEDSNATGVNGDGSNNSASLSGAAYVFVRNGTTWSQQAYLKASNTNTNDSFGQSVSISADTIVVGAYDEASSATGVNGNQSDNTFTSAGAAYVFVRNAGVWTQEAYLKESNTGVGDWFGWSVAISGNTLVVGAQNEKSAATGVNGDQSDNSMNSAGAAYVFVRSGTTWTQQAYLKASNTGPDQFGYSVAISGDTIAVSAVAEASVATGVDGDQSNNSALSSGAVYVFRRIAGNWAQVYYVKATNTDAADAFGLSLALSGDLLVAGAPAEDSNATGINGVQSNNSATSAGAAYIYDLGLKPGTSSYGTGTPGCAGTQTLDVTHAPMIGSPAFRFSCTNAPPSSLGLGIVTDSKDLGGSDPFGIGVLMHVDFIFATEILPFDFYSDGTGYSETANINIPNNPLLVGKSFYAMALWAWTTCSLPPNHLSTSRGLELVLQAP